MTQQHKRTAEQLRSTRWFGPDDLRSFGHRSRMMQMGLGPEDWEGRPIIGILNTWSEMNPCHLHFRDRAEDVKKGIAQAGGLGLEIPTISIDESFTKPTSMLYRNLLAMETEEMIAFLRKVTPNINMAVRGNHLIISADTNPANLAHMIQEAGQRRGAANPVVSAVAAKAGPAVQQVVTGDLMAVIAWMTEWMEEIEEEEYTAIKGNPIPFSSSMTIDGASYGGQWTMDMPAVKRLVEAVQELEEMEREAARNDDDSDKEEETETE